MSALKRRTSTIANDLVLPYPNQIGTTFEADFRCVPGFLYIPHVEPLTHLIEFMTWRGDLGDADMVAIGLFRKMFHKEWIDFLPTVTPEYVADHFPMQSITGTVSQESETYCSYFGHFQSVFDAASLGIYLGGGDPTYHFSSPGKVNPNSVFVPTYCSIAWETDEEGRRIPLFVYQDKKCKINNLHLTNKDLLPTFLSKEMPIR